MDINEVKADAAKANGIFKKIVAFVQANPKTALAISIAVVVGLIVVSSLV